MKVAAVKTVAAIQRIRIRLEMLPCTIVGNGSPALVMMPFLGGTQSEWKEVNALLSHRYTCVTIDLPGFGLAAEVIGYGVRAMADSVIETLRHLRSEKNIGAYVLVGHSMAGKVSAVVTRMLLDNNVAATVPAGVVLVSPSPPSPEPMKDDKRAKMLGMFRGTTHESDYGTASSYIAENVFGILKEDRLARAANGVLQMNRDAWNAWLESGSKEDWSAFVATIDLPAMIIAGDHDEALGPAVQRKVTLPHFSSAELLQFDCGHLAPLEQPDALASAIQRFVSTLAI